MRNTKKLTAVLLALIMLLSFAACKSKGNSGTDSSGSDSGNTEYEVPKIPFSSEDGLNPYAAVSMLNEVLFPLMYDGLFTIGDDYTASPSIAASYKNSGTTLTVVLDSAKRFSDGSVISASDVLYSFNLAKASSLYGNMLLAVDSAKASGSKEVIFTLTNADCNAASCLTFPILKDGTAADNTSVPVGYGMYVYKSTGTESTLSYNTSYKTDYKVNSKTVNLINITDSSAINYSLMIGNIDTLFDDLSGTEPGRLNSSTAYVTMNNLLYIGINQSNTILSDPLFIEYLSYLLDRDTIVNEGYSGYAVSSGIPFNPEWKDAEKLDNLKLDKDTAKKYVASKAKGQTLKLLVNSDNSFKVSCAEAIVKDLSGLGVSVTVVSQNYEQYTASVSSGTYDLYLGEIKLSNDMSILPLLAKDSDMYNAFNSYLNSEITLKDFVKTWNSNMSFITIGYRTGVFAYSRDIKDEITTYANNIYANVCEWQIKAS